MTTISNRVLVGNGRSDAHQGPIYEAYRILQIGFIAAPIIAGVDKFFDRLVDWDVYLAPGISDMFGGNIRAIMMFAGVIEIAAGVLVALKPRYFAYVVSAWLTLIIMNLLMTGAYYDVALRDLGLALGALALGRLASVFDTGFGF